MARGILRSQAARGSLAQDRKSTDGVDMPERFCAWDEDRTTLAIDAAAGLHAPVAFVGPGIDRETIRVALDLPAVHLAGDPLAMAMAAAGPALAVGCPDEHSAVACLVGDGGDAAPREPTLVSGPPRMVSTLRALQETRRVAPAERVPDSPMGAYVPMGTWVEDLPARLRLVAQRCAGCGKTLYPPRGACPACRSRAFDDVQLPPRARVHAATRIGRGGAPSEFALEQAQVGAYWVGVVEWPEAGVRVTARLSGFDERAPRIGDEVRPVVRRLFEQEGAVRYGAKFVLA